MDIVEQYGFITPKVGDVVNGDIGIPEPGGSYHGWVVQSVGPGLNVYVFPNGEEVIADEAGNILG